MKIDIPLKHENATEVSIKEFLSHYHCELVSVNKDTSTITISTHEAENLFWMGCNWNNGYLNELRKEISELKSKLQLAEAKSDGVFDSVY